VFQKAGYEKLILENILRKSIIYVFEKFVPKIFFYKTYSGIYFMCFRNFIPKFLFWKSYPGNVFQYIFYEFQKGC